MKILKTVVIFFSVIPCSWIFAVLWREHGDWWIHAQPPFLKKLIYGLMNPVLSSDITVAEDQLEFLSFWAPSFLGLLLLLSLLIVIWRLRS